GSRAPWQAAAARCCKRGSRARRGIPYPHHDLDRWEIYSLLFTCEFFDLDVAVPNFAAIGLEGDATGRQQYSGQRTAILGDRGQVGQQMALVSIPALNLPSRCKQERTDRSRRF